ncbi:MAG: 50S ribosomal protein L24 [Candidatus Moranbacteria bacterium CG_4_10_14_3_um_filter_45_9]|nr:MAG: 50S ribosomal protein L24 [Candidatus Moranbacteria bacterium CG2_30_45_14]PIX90160.1 MAG: 50S ribosomal protein L24 [Candidatus Moranbacteria bacterium CG_4_10_14_3_um_filter_45_9]PJA85909.1 MAG: 50S ribosomal protein L24 [Candidatus Moranbacteria bacterium CG_4_9_14_3_um_filter_45_14]
MKIRKGDQVEITAGKDSGKRGEVLYVFPKLEKIVVKGANIVKRHIKAKRDGEKGQRVEKEAPFHISNVMLVCPHTGKLTRIGYAIEGGEKVRISKKSGKAI